MRREHAAGKPFFLYPPFSMGHIPKPAKEFAGKSRIGEYRDKMMEGDYRGGQILDGLSANSPIRVRRTRAIRGRSALPPSFGGLAT
jgi:hypothetical protein